MTSMLSDDGQDFPMAESHPIMADSDASVYSGRSVAGIDIAYSNICEVEK